MFSTQLVKSHAVLVMGNMDDYNYSASSHVTCRCNSKSKRFRIFFFILSHNAKQRASEGRDLPAALKNVTNLQASS